MQNKDECQKTDDAQDQAVEHRFPVATKTLQ
jgi:hypothetical protein